jgi:hypothetical protein
MVLKLKTIRREQKLSFVYLCICVRANKITALRMRHHLPAGIYGFSGGKKNIKFYFPPPWNKTSHLLFFFRKPSISTHLMAIVALITICLIHLL